jgi:pilus assembly protein Flp/PilA
MTLLTLTLNGLIMNFIKNFIAEEDGVTAIEYALIAALVAAALVAGVGLFTTGLKDAFKAIGTKLSGIAI